MREVGQEFICDFDDYSSLRPGQDILEKIREHFPNFKVTLFTVPFSAKFLTKEVPIEKLKEWAKLVKENSDWMEIAPHGFVHTRQECVTNREQAITMIKATENIFKKIGLPFVKIYKAPHWEMSKEFEEVLKERGYVLAVDRNNPEAFTDIKNYIWNWSVDEPLPNYHTIKGHGHMHLTNNGLDTCLENLLKMPTDAEFKFVSEYLNDRGINVERVSA